MELVIIHNLGMGCWDVMTVCRTGLLAWFGTEEDAIKYMEQYIDNFE